MASHDGCRSNLPFWYLSSSMQGMIVAGRLNADVADELGTATLLYDAFRHVLHVERLFSNFSSVTYFPCLCGSLITACHVHEKRPAACFERPRVLWL